MTVTREDAAMALEFIMTRCARHIDTVLVATEVSSNKLVQTALGSAVCLEVDAQTVLVTCDHVVAKGGYHYCGPKQLSKPMMDEESGGVAPAAVLRRSNPLDLAALRYGVGAEEKAPWPLEHAKDVDRAFLASQIGAASFILGAWGEQARAVSYPAPPARVVAYFTGSTSQKMLFVASRRLSRPEGRL